MPWYGFTFQGILDKPDFTSSVDVGQVFLYASSARIKPDYTGYEVGVPEGFLRCDGSSVLIADYPDLYAFLTSLTPAVDFGAAPAGEFMLPNMGGVFPYGYDSATVAVDTIGKTGGTSGHSHTAAANHTHGTPTHTHSVGAHAHTGVNFTGHTHSNFDHKHTAGGLYNSQGAPDQARLYADTAAPYDFYVSRAGHVHDIVGRSALGGTGNSTGPRNTSNAALTQTQGITGTAPTTSSTSDTSLGNPSPAVSLNSTGSNTIPSYYSLYYIIKV